MDPGGTIVALSSAPGRSRRAVVRVSGPSTRRLIERATGATGWSRSAVATRLTLGALELPILLVRYEAGASATGEDAAELLIPGNPRLVERVMESLLAGNEARPAQPGEFTLRAFLNGRLSIEQAEGVALAIAARSAEELDAASALLSGATGARYAEWREELAALLALVEAGVDFTDQEDVAPIPPADLASRLGSLAGALRSTLARAGPGAAPGDRAVVVLAGPPNAGKSTLFNALLGRPRTIIADEPGTTRDAVREPVDLAPGLCALGGCPVELVDLAGLDGALAARSPIDLAAQDAARAAAAGADVVVLCDPTGRFGLAIELPASARVLRVRTKADLPGSGGDVAVCALDGAGLGSLRRAVADAAAAARSGGAQLVVPRHRAALAAALGHVGAALSLLEARPRGRHIPEIELVGAELRSALDAIGEVAGRVPPDDVIGRIFAGFCVGK